MKLDWTKNLKETPAQENFKQQLYRSSDVLSRLSDLLTEYEKSLDRNETDPASFDTPNWDYKQAYKNGYRACLLKIKELVNIDNKEV